MSEATRTRLPEGETVSLARRARGALLVTHPLPSLLYVVMVALCAFVAAAAAHTTPDPSRLVRALVGVACAQVAIGALNDYCDRASDAVSQPSKPIPSGLIAPWQALALVLLASVAVVITMATLGPLALALGLLVEGLGLAYDLWFKGTLVSAFLYAVYFPLIPLLAWAIFGRWQPFLPWLLPLAAALGVAMNVANTLPDLEGDAAAGSQSLAHALGLRRGLLFIWATPLVALATIWALHLSGAAPGRAPVLLLATLAGLLSVGLAMALYRARPVPATLKRTFLIQALGVVLLGAGWLAAVAF